MIDTIDRGRDAVRRHEWPAAVEAFTAADQETPLEPDDLELLGSAAWWGGRPDEATEAMERAFAGYVAGERPIDAARVALTLAYEGFRGLSEPVGAGWLAQAERLLANEPESPLHARLHVFHAIPDLLGSRLDPAIEELGKALEVARRQHDDNALYMALSFRGMAEVYQGKVDAGMREVDEAAAGASSGLLDLRIASDIFCNTISACRSIGDLGRAGKWADEGERFMLRHGAGGYPGVCRIHRAEIKMLRGRWSEAEQDARLAGEELERYRLLDAVGYASYQVGEVRLRMGDLDGAVAAFDRAYEYGHDALPGLARLQLALGDVGTARRSIDRALMATAAEPGAADRGARARLLPAKVDIALAEGDLEAAREAVDELESIAAHFEQPLFRAGAMTARGELLLGEARAPEASPVLSQSWRLWQTADIPYESAQARLHYAQALAAEGDETTARRDLLAARSVFVRLGATRDVERVDALLGETAPPIGSATSPGAGGERVTRTFMFTDIVTSTDLVGLIGDEAWGEVLNWHDRELRSCFAQHRGEVANHTGDGFFVAFDRPSDAIECAVEIQRRLVRHRREHGFAPSVRIGLHTSEATRDGRDFRGRGVHLAARVGAAANREEILISRAVAEAAGGTRHVLSEPHEVELKGIREPVEVMAVSWR